MPRKNGSCEKVKKGFAFRDVSLHTKRCSCGSAEHKGPFRELSLHERNIRGHKREQEGQAPALIGTTDRDYSQLISEPGVFVFSFLVSIL